MHEGGVGHIVGKFLTRVTTLLKPRPNPRSEKIVTVLQSYKSPNFGSFGTPPWES
jgi:hypothetical protein